MCLRPESSSHFAVVNRITGALRLGCEFDVDDCSSNSRMGPICTRLGTPYPPFFSLLES